MLSSEKPAQHLDERPITKTVFVDYVLDKVKFSKFSTYHQVTLKAVVPTKSDSKWHVNLSRAILCLEVKESHYLHFVFSLRVFFLMLLLNINNFSKIYLTHELAPNRYY